MKEITKKLKAILLYPFKLLKRFLRIILIMLTIYICYLGYDYYKNGNKINQGEACIPIVDQLTKFKGKTYCLDARNLDIEPIEFGKTYYSVLFLARSKLKEIAYTGHGWLAWFKFQQVDSNNILVEEFLPAGYGGNIERVEWTVEQIDLYVKKIKPNIPKAKQAFVERILKSLALSPVKYNESTTIIGPGNPTQIPLNEISNIFTTKNLGDNPSIISFILIDPDDYESSKVYYEEYTKKTYRLFYHDCTTLLLNLLKDFGMYRPPRILCPFPEQTVQMISQSNLRE